MTTQITEAA